MELEEEPFELNVCIEEVFRSSCISLAAKKSGSSISCRSGDSAIYCRRQAPFAPGMYNLVGNAVKFTEKGEIIITVGLNHQNKKGLELLFAVKDTGIGIPIHKIEKTI